MPLSAFRSLFFRYHFARFPLLSPQFLAIIYHTTLTYIIDNKDFTLFFSVDFIRVNDRTWDSDPNQTRFGTIVYTNDTNVAYLQFEGNHDGDSTEGIQHFESFYLSEQPFDDGTTTTWRLQIHERKVLQIDYSCELQWKGEIWKSATRKGYSSWTGASTVEDSEVDIPELSGSGYLFGFVTNETSSDGEMDVEFDATAYWEYN